MPQELREGEPAKETPALGDLLQALADHGDALGRPRRTRPQPVRRPGVRRTLKSRRTRHDSEQQIPSGTTALRAPEWLGLRDVASADDEASAVRAADDRLEYRERIPLPAPARLERSGTNA